MMDLTKEIETSLVNTINKGEHGYDIDIKSYQKVQAWMPKDRFKKLMKELKFKKIGSIYDYAEDVPMPEYVSAHQLSLNSGKTNMLCVSEKINSFILYSNYGNDRNCICFIDVDYIQKFAKYNKKIMKGHMRGADIFKGIDFKPKKGTYIEISQPIKRDSDTIVEVVTKKIKKEHLVFDETSTIVKVKKEIENFFTKENKEMFKRMRVTYKRGMILHGNPGNGKSAMIREIIRSIPGIVKIVLNPNINKITLVLSVLMKKLKGQPALIIIEDIDSLITSRNRSEFLNILDGVDQASGVFFIGTTNYPEKIDPAFMNRPGRFDRTYRIDDPTASTRRIFFKSRDVRSLFSSYKIYDDPNIICSGRSIVELFVKYTEGLPMAGLKEVLTSTQYNLASNPDMSIDEAIKLAAESIKGTKMEHHKSHKKFIDENNFAKAARLFNMDDDDDDDDF